MTLSNTCKAALKAVIFLASEFETIHNATIKMIAKNIGENEHTVGKLLQTLTKQNIISSIKGPSGGFFMNKSQIRIPMLKVVEAIDGKNVFKRCGLGLDKCSKNHPCPIHFEYQVARDHLEELMKNKSILNLCEQVRAGKAFLSD